MNPVIRKAKDCYSWLWFLPWLIIPTLFFFSRSFSDIHFEHLFRDMVLAPLTPATLQVHGLAVDPFTPATLYAWTRTEVYKSANSGGTWQAISAGFGSEHRIQEIIPVMADSLYALTYDGVYKSMNGGKDWQPTITGISDVDTLVVNPLTPTTLYLLRGDSVYKSVNGGIDWSLANNGLGNNDTLIAEPVTPGEYYMVTSSGVYKSTNRGRDWTESNTNLGEIDVLGVDESQGIYFVKTPADWYTSSDGGKSWDLADITDISGQVFQVALDSSFAITSEGLYVRSAGSENWCADSAVNVGCDIEIFGLVIDPVKPSTLYAWTHDDIFKTTNGGENWSATNTGLDGDIDDLEINPVTPTTLYTVSRGKVHKSTNGGEQWRLASNGIPPNVNINSLVIDPVTPEILYVEYGDGGYQSIHGVYKSINGGETWSDASTGMDGHVSIKTLVVDPVTPDILYAEYGDGIYRSIDGGKSWSDASAGLYGYIHTIVLNPLASGTLYATTADGVFKSKDSAESWNAANTGLANLGESLPAVLLSSLWYLFLLIPALDKQREFVRWHGRQALLLAGLLTAVRLVSLVIGYFFAVNEWSILAILLVVWFLGTIWGQRQAARGDCALMRWTGHGGKLPLPTDAAEPSAEPGDEKQVSLPKAVIIGAISGNITVLIAILGFQVLIMGPGVIFSFFLLIDAVISFIGVPFGIVGSLIGRSWLKTSIAAWAGGFICVIFFVLLILIMGGGPPCFLLGGC